MHVLLSCNPDNAHAVRRTRSCLIHHSRASSVRWPARSCVPILVGDIVKMMHLATYFFLIRVLFLENVYSLFSFIALKVTQRLMQCCPLASDTVSPLEKLDRSGWCQNKGRLGYANNCRFDWQVIFKPTDYVLLVVAQIFTVIPSPIRRVLSFKILWNSDPRTWPVYFPVLAYKAGNLQV